MKYMIIDMTDLEATSVLKIADNRSAPLFGQIYKAAGKVVIAPPLDGRSFAKLEKMQLQYLYWNTCGEAPPEIYSELVQKCLAVLENLQRDSTPIEDLKREVAKLYPKTEAEDKPSPKPSGTFKPGEVARPRQSGATGRVWEIADRLFSELGSMPDRKAIIQACQDAGINPATAATQYAKWVKEKRSI